MDDPIERAAGPDAGDPRAITRPDPALHTYYLISSLFGLILFPFIYLPLRFRYVTLRYRFDEEGVSVSWGRFFQRETYLTYRRIQDIQVSRGVLQRRLGLATLELQTASGGAGAEMRIEGIREPDRLRDFLYERMRGGSAEGEDPAQAGGDTDDGRDEALRLLREIRDELQAANRSRDSLP